MMEIGLTRRSSPILLILILTGINQMILSMAVHHNDTSKRISLKDTRTAAKMFMCKEPQMRAYNLQDLVQRSQPSESIEQPKYIVLKRCDSHAGCCWSFDLSCMPMSIYYEHIEIEIYNLRTKRTKQEWIRVEQHNNCSCEFSNANERSSRDSELPCVLRSSEEESSRTFCKKKPMHQGRIKD